MTDNILLRIRRAVAQSLSTKLSLIILLLAVPVFAISLGLLFSESRYLIRKEAMGRANSELTTTMQHMRRYVSSVEKATDACAMFIADNLKPDYMLNLTRYIVSVNADIDGCSISMEPNVFPEYGRYFSVYSIREKPLSENLEVLKDSVTTVMEEPYDYFNKVWYKTPRMKNTACWVDYYDEADTLELTLNGMLASYGRPIHDASGRMIGIMSTDLSLTRLSKIFSQEKPYPHSYFMMLDAEGHYLVHPDSTLLFSHTIFDGLDPSRQADLIALGHEITNGSEGSMFIDVNGVPCLVTYQPVPGISWYLALVCPDSDILAGYHKLTYIIVPLLLFGLLFISLLCRHAVAHSISPLNQLLEKTQIIASGNMEVHIPRSQRIDAVGRLQNSFASMLQRLNFHMGSVRYTAGLAQQRYEELAQTTMMAEEAERQKTIFIQNVSHQIRTPLNIIMGFAQIFSSCPEAAFTAEEMKGITSTMDHNSKLLYRLVLMLFDSSETGFYEELNSNRQDLVSCNEVVRETISYLFSHYPGIKVNFHTDVPDDFRIQTNSLYLMRSLRELLYNSAKYSDGQNIRISVALREDRQTVCFIVEDTGMGISEADYDRMFTFFTKADDLSEGLGLGLPLAKRHVLNLGGDLTIDASYHDGCRFIVELPYSAKGSMEA